MKTKYAVFLALSVSLLLITGVYAVGEMAKKQSVRFNQDVEVDESVYNELSSKGKFNEQEIIEKGIEQVEKEAMRDLVQEIEYQFFVMKNTKNYEGMRQTLEFMKQLNQGKY